MEEQATRARTHDCGSTYNNSTLTKQIPVVQSDDVQECIPAKNFSSCKGPTHEGWQEAAKCDVLPGNKQAPNVCGVTELHVLGEVLKAVDLVAESIN